ncbi:ATP-dependent DNA helicase RecQ [Cytophaga sp. FL35]|uniref:RecQ family ATP-dependent DNA helicase n=1 Tax=Cytophaga sp. FL35 TaxID=1904456 RepID=UPI001653D4C9|nr:ATP-dependent DNA helicase RecQ [Cytophaga sp. FL35]MBC6999166.1 RecQ family ATP-dependent DNA helicase [Cytophaga sp. FL35]
MITDPRDTLQRYWGFSGFRGSQKKIIQAALNGEDVLALLPTGGGKSICFQVPAMSQEGICIVVSPLVALIHDQVTNLKNRGIKAIALTGGISFEELVQQLDNCLYGGYKFLYLSPERLQQDLVIERIQQMNVNLIAIDEAHCISQWGHDFRPAYLDCGQLRVLLPTTPIMALTATATREVAKDIITHLNLKEPLNVKDSFLRENIAFKVKITEDKLYQLKQLCGRNKSSGIVYTSSRKMTVKLAHYLNSNQISATFFHGGLTKKDKQDKLQQWLNNDVLIMVATNAFGMGVDKPDVGLVVHYQIPDSLENYFQEAGRAGRNGRSAQAILLTNEEDESLLKKQFLGSLPDTSFLKKLYNKLNNYFQISFGEGHNESFQFNFNEFVSIYKLNPYLAYNSLKVLDQYSVISLSESFSKLTSVQFIARKEKIFDYLEVYPRAELAVKTILRTYGGIFDFETKINTHLVAQKTGLPEAQILSILEQLERDEIIAYVSKHNDLDLTFLVPREDDRTINVFAYKVKELNHKKAEKLRAMMKYVHTTSICRSKQLLTYFGERLSDDCKRCDVCLEKYGSNVSIIKVQESITHLLDAGAKSSRILSEHLNIEEPILLKALRSLLEQEKIKINTKNEYELR